VKLASRRYGTGDLAAQYYDAQVFDGATFGDIDLLSPKVLDPAEAVLPLRGRPVLE
jgi:hypothetical protein